MDTELLEAEELDVDQTRSARHERPVFLRSPPLPTRKRPADDLRSVLQRQTASPPPDDQGTGTLAHPWKNGP